MRIIIQSCERIFFLFQEAALQLRLKRWVADNMKKKKERAFQAKGRDRKGLRTEAVEEYDWRLLTLRTGE